MGTQNAMRRSLDDATNFLFSFQMDVTTASNGKDVSILRMMDGCYVFSKQSHTIREFLIKLFCEVSERVIEEELQYVNLIRGAVSYGAVVSDLDLSLPKHNEKWESFRNSFFAGMPMIQAYSGDSEAPPFGVFVHESARSAEYRDAAFSQKWFRLFDRYQNRKALEEKVNGYFEHCKKLKSFLDYPEEKITKHSEMFAQYMSLHEKTGEAR